jgi:UDPglucose 6-dehydrogenase
LAFKPNTDDIREAPSLYIIDEIVKAGGRVTAYDPEANNNVRGHYASQQGVTVVDEPYEALQHADALLVATEWHVFQGADLERMATLLTNKVVFDGRNIYDLEHMRRHGFYYESIGRPTVTPA